MNKRANQEPQKFDNASQWEDLMKVATISDETRQLLMVQGKLNDVYAIAAKVIREYNGDDEVLSNFYVHINNASNSLMSVMADIMLGKINDVGTTSI